jgi:hypothetical protein
MTKVPSTYETKTPLRMRISWGALRIFLRKTKIHLADYLITATVCAEHTPVATVDQDSGKFAHLGVETSVYPVRLCVRESSRESYFQGLRADPPIRG